MYNAADEYRQVYVTNVTQNTTLSMMTLIDLHGYITPILNQLHWVTTATYKIGVLTYKSLFIKRPPVVPADRQHSVHQPCLQLNRS